MKRNAVSWAALAVATAALVSSRGLTRPMPAAPSLPAESQKAANALSDAFVAVAEFVKPSVVQISVERKGKSTIRIPGGNRNPFQGPGRGNGNEVPKDFEEMLKKFFGPEFRPEREQFGPAAEGTGSGFVYDDRGHVLTNNHVVEGSSKITVTFNDGVEASATVVGTDPKSDVAVIKVDNTSYRPLQRGTSGKLKVGEMVMAVGSPFGLSQTVTTGIISATERNEFSINGPDSYESFLQTDAAINPGNSGGPLVDMSGRVIGINSAIVSGSRGNDGVGFAIPIDLASNVADKLIKDGKVSRARVGIVLQPLTPAIAKQLGYPASKVKWTVEPFNSSYAPGPKSFDFDVNQISITPARAKVVDFSTGYYRAAQAVIVLNTSKYADVTTLAALKGAHIGAQIGTTSLLAAQDDIKPNSQVAVFDDTNAAKQALVNGTIDVIIADVPTAPRAITGTSSFVTAVTVSSETDGFTPR